MSDAASSKPLPQASAVPVTAADPEGHEGYTDLPADSDGHYAQYRTEQAEQLGDAGDGAFRHARQEGRQDVIAPRHEDATHSFGRAISEAIMGSRDPSPDALQRAREEDVEPSPAPRRLDR